jgi:hypothetical protein
MGLNSALSPKKRRAESLGATDHDEKKQKARLAEPSGTEADKALKGSESVASNGAKATDVKEKAAEAAKTNAAKDAEAAAADKAAKEKGKALVISKAPRQEAKEGHDVVMTQSPAVDEVVNKSAPYQTPVGDFVELHKQLAIAHKVSPVRILARVFCIVMIP